MKLPPRTQIAIPFHEHTNILRRRRRALVKSETRTEHFVFV